MDKQKSLYFHIPFCVRRCNYCDFTTYSGMDKWIPAYFDALQKQIILAVKEENVKPQIHTIFFGGGTPSVVPVREYENLMRVVKSAFSFDENLEMSLEANPGTIQHKDLTEYQRVGFNRISLGVQSFQPEELKLLGRIHDIQDTLDVIADIRQAGFHNLNLDLIYGLPGQSVRSWGESLDQALDLQPEHLSLYCLTIEEGTPLADMVARGEVVPLEDDNSAEMYELAIRILDNAGYRHYEISNWAKRSSENKDYRCLHNLQYWKNEEYYGFGAGAHGYIRNLRVVNYSKIPNFITYIHKAENINSTYAECRETNQIERMQDEMMLGLRLVDEGISANSFRLKFGREMTDTFSKEISRLLNQNLIQWTNGEGSSLTLTERGTMLGNQVFMEFVGD